MAVMHDMIDFESDLVAAIHYARPIAFKILSTRGLSADTDDVLQNAAVKVIRKHSNFRRECQFRTWFVRIVIHEALMYMRAIRGQVKVGGNVMRREFVPVELIAPLLAAKGPSPVEVTYWGELHDAIDRLSPLLRDEIWKGLMGYPAEGANGKSRRWRARARLRGMLS
jgi:DNA-directed RNA polymerase specialized sigma24 family protein